MIGIYAMAAVAEIAGCFAFWSWLRLGQSVWWIVPGIGLLVFFAVLLARVDSALAGRAYAAYGGVYVASSILWLVVAEHTLPDRWDLLGGMIIIIGALIIIFGPHNDHVL